LIGERIAEPSNINLPKRGRAGLSVFAENFTDVDP
jgi:hypothetical protein